MFNIFVRILNSTRKIRFNRSGIDIKINIFEIWQKKIRNILREKKIVDDFIALKRRVTVN